ncbi:MAG: hypothetical protein EXR83_15390 [Gammaproteobacteria bacterium]|nr:hypothetical protein [Gammaproteobacteria bacterium]
MREPPAGALLGRAIACFHPQTFAPRELLVLYEADDHVTRDYLATVQDPAGRGIAVPTLPKLTLGAWRNRAIAPAAAITSPSGTMTIGRRRTAWRRRRRTAGKAPCVLSRWIL